MSERDYSWDYDAWLRNTGGDPFYGQPEPPQPGAPPVPQEPRGPNWIPPVPTTPPREGYQWMIDPRTNTWVETPRGGFPQTTDRPGTDYDRQVSIDRVPGSGSGDVPIGPGGGGGFGGGSYAWGGAWPSYTMPGYLDPGEFDPGPAFTYQEFTHPDFVKPSAESVLSDPGFQFRLDQGRKALEASAAGKGTLRSGGTLKDILGYGQNFASQEYGNVWNRALTEYDTNRNNAFGNWNANRQNAWDTWQSGYTGRKDAYGFNADNVGRHNIFNQTNSLNDFNARQRQAEMEFQDAYNRWRAEGDWLSGGGFD